MASRWSNFLTGLAVALFIAGSGLALVGLILASPNPIVSEAKAQQLGPVYCSQMASAGGGAGSGLVAKVQVVAAPSGSGRIFVCGMTVSALAASVVSFQSGTGSDCASNSVTFGPTIQLGATSTYDDGAAMFRGFLVPAARALCATATAAANVTIYYNVQ